MRTAQSVTPAASRSRPEWAASARIPKLRVMSPTTSFRTVSTIAARSDETATRSFSRADSSRGGDVAALAIHPAYFSSFSRMFRTAPTVS